MAEQDLAALVLLIIPLAIIIAFICRRPAPQKSPPAVILQRTEPIYVEPRKAIVHDYVSLSMCPVYIPQEYKSLPNEGVEQLEAMQKNYSSEYTSKSMFPVYVPEEYKLLPNEGAPRNVQPSGFQNSQGQRSPVAAIKNQQMYQVIQGSTPVKTNLPFGAGNTGGQVISDVAVSGWMPMGPS
jgi:hypothetical protein